MGFRPESFILDINYNVSLRKYNRIMSRFTDKPKIRNAITIANDILYVIRNINKYIWHYVKKIIEIPTENAI